MDILVCVKWVPDDFAEVHLDPSGLPDTQNIEKAANAFDTYALELAARYCEANGGAVSVAAIAPQGAESMLKNLLAVGAKKAFLFNDPLFEGSDEGAAAAYLEAVVRKCEKENGTPYGLILCGKESTDEISGQVGARLAERLGRAFVSSVVEVSPAENSLLARQETEDGCVCYRTDCGAVYTVAKPDYEPRYPNIKTKMAARKAVIPVFTAADTAVQPQRNRILCQKYTKPPKRSAGTKILEKEAAEAVRKAMEQLTQDHVL